MMQITLELTNPEDENILLLLLKRLEINYSIKKESVEKEQPVSRKVYAHRFIVDNIELPTRDELYDR